ncbi:MAG: ECF transporter S component [Lachnospiraceae bacterium]|nr:ECF transporter S component [Lachnospiraceae bacterium]
MSQTAVNEMKRVNTAGRADVRKLCVTGMLSAISFVLMFLDFSVPFIMPTFIKLDISELPALVGAFSLGPVYGVIICLIKNLINFLVRTTTGGVGELSNFILGAVFVYTAGLFYKRKKAKKTALIGATVGAVIMAIFSVFSNYYLVYPIYTAFMPMEAIMAAYQAINPNVHNLWDALIWFNMPFTFAKGMLDVLITMLIYKKLSPILKGNR